MTKNSTSFKDGNKAAVKNPKIVVRKFFQMLENAKEDKEILSFQDACHSIKWRDSKVNYWCSKLPVFATLKTDIQNAIVRRINKGALKSDFNPASCIWRMKQLGEHDERVIDNKSSDGSMSQISLTPEAAKAISKGFNEGI